MLRKHNNPDELCRRRHMVFCARNRHCVNRRYDRRADRRHGRYRNSKLVIRIKLHYVCDGYN